MPKYDIRCPKCGSLKYGTSVVDEEYLGDDRYDREVQCNCSRCNHDFTVTEHLKIRKITGILEFNSFVANDCNCPNCRSEDID